jgi:hypothetical protein
MACIAVAKKGIPATQIDAQLAPQKKCRKK